MTHMLSAEAQELRKEAAQADPIMRSVYRSLAAEAEVRATLSLKTPIMKEEAAPKGGSYSQDQIGEEYDGSEGYENAPGKSPETAEA
jgi:hypothetical protein